MKKNWPRISIVLVAIVVIGAVTYGPITRNLQSRQDERFKTQCQQAGKDANWKGLRVAAQAWLEKSPESDDAKVFLAEAAIQLDELELAVESLGAVDDNYQGALGALSIRADLLFSDLNRPYEAEEAWQRMLRINNSASVAHQRLIYFYAMTLQRGKLLDAIHRAIEAEAEPPEAYSYLLLANALNFSDGLKHATRWRKSYPNDETLEVSQAIYVARLSADSAIATFGSNSVAPGDQTLVKECLSKYPENLELLAFEMELAIFDGNPARVAEVLEQAPEAAANDSRFWGARGWLLEQKGALEPALAALEHSIQIDPFRWQSRWQAADVCRKLMQSEKADEFSRVALLGKDLQRDLFEQPTARNLTPELAARILAYVEEVGDERTLSALNRRI